jgi:hypothetical protein
VRSEPKTPRRESVVFWIYSGLGLRPLVTPAECRERAAECRQMAEREQDFRRQNILLDIGRTWTRLALEAEQWIQTNRAPLRLKKAPSKDRLTVISSIPSAPPAAPRARSDC